MLRSLRHTTGFSIRASDGDIGKVNDIFFDDEAWTVRYFVADTGHWLPGRKVLLSPTSVTGLDWDGRAVAFNQTREQVEQSPPVESDQPVSRQMEYELAVHYAWPTYWGAAGGITHPVMVAPAQETVISEKDAAEDQTHAEKNHLQSVRDVHGYRIHARDGEFGRVEDFYAEEGEWTIRWIAIDTRNWLPGRKVLVSPRWISGIVWESGEVVVEFDQETIRGSPEFDEGKPIDRDYEEQLYRHYGRPPHWEA